MVDSGINASAELTAALKGMEQIGKNKYDFIIIHLNKLPSKGNKIDYGIDIGKTQDVGESEKKYEGQDLGDRDPVFQDVKDMLLSEYKEDACFVQFYLKYNLEGNREQNKLMFLSWVPDSAPAKKKMIMSSTSKGLAKKAPQGVISLTVNDATDLDYKEFKSVASAGKSR